MQKVVVLPAACIAGPRDFRTDRCSKLAAAILWRAVKDVRSADKKVRQDALNFLWSDWADALCRLLGEHRDDLLKQLNARPEADESD